LLPGPAVAPVRSPTAGPGGLDNKLESFDRHRAGRTRSALYPPAGVSPGPGGFSTGRFAGPGI
jgi:hypothetical protein